MDIPIMLNGNQTNEKFSKWNRRKICSLGNNKQSNLILNIFSKLIKLIYEFQIT